jgi:hypothetical protein
VNEEVGIVLDDDTVRFLSGGCSLLVGTVSADGRPHAGRGWGITVLEREPLRVRVLLDARDARTLENARGGARIALCTADVPTLHSVQLKGRVIGAEPATDADREKQRQYTDAFLHDIHSTDGDPLHILHRWAECDVVAAIVEVDESFDQTPGPSAGTVLARATP